MKRSLTALAALAAVAAVPTVALASPNLDFTVMPPPGVHLLAMADAPHVLVPRDAKSAQALASATQVFTSANQALASAEPLIYPDIPAKVTMDDHLAVLTPRAAGVTAPQATALIVPRNGDASESLASAETTYLASECPSVMAHPGDHTALLGRFCQDKRG